MRPKLTVNVELIAENYRLFQKLTKAEVAPVVKANAYGLGATEIVTRLRSQARHFFVATVEEAIELAPSLPNAVIYELSGLSIFQNDLPLQVIPVVNTPQQVKAINERPFALQFDTGMSRLGLNEKPELSQAPQMVMSHLACADEPLHPQNDRQLRSFLEISQSYPSAVKSLTASEGVFLGQNYHFDLIRPGIGLYGGVEYDGLRCPVRVELPVLQIRKLKSGETIGYGATFFTNRSMNAAVVMGGYADGFRRALSNRGFLYAGQEKCPILGRVSMDSQVVDVSHLAELPDYLTYFSTTNELLTQAKCLDTIPYEVLTSIGNRVERIYERSQNSL